jgi:short-subunit dehydrogenase
VESAKPLQKALAKVIDRPKIYIVSRKEGAGARILNELNTLGPSVSYHFIKADLTLLQNVDGVRERVKSGNVVVDLLFLSTGHLGTEQVCMSLFSGS